MARVVNVSGKVDSGTGHNLSEEGQLADTSVLDLNITQAVESFFSAVSTEHSKRIEKVQGWLGAEFVLECVVKRSRGRFLLEQDGSGRRVRGVKILIGAVQQLSHLCSSYLGDGRERGSAGDEGGSNRKFHVDFGKTRREL